MSATVAAFAASGLLGDAPSVAHHGHVGLRSRCGRRFPLHPDRWHRAPSSEEVAALAGLSGPVLDLACGPGRLVAHLLGRGVAALGVDSSADAVAAARRRGAPAVLADVWGPLPDEGSWGAVLLFDGNLGIGADPAALLVRCGSLLAPRGVVVAEVGGAGTGCGPLEVRIERPGWASPWFPWATVGLDDLDGLAAEAGLVLAEVRTGPSGRHFAHLRAA